MEPPLHPPPDLTHHVVKLHDQYLEGGGFGDVYMCQYNSSSGPTKVAVKALRFKFDVELEGDDNKKSVKMLRREIGIWRRLNHTNVVPFLGIAYGFGKHGAMSLVSLWMPNGTLETFLEKHDCELSVAHRLQLLLDVANGLRYLHSFPIIHGDLNSNNVLLDADYTARLTDFGFSSLVGDIPEALTYLRRSTRRAGALRWIAPEQLQVSDSETGRMTKSDVYSFGSIALQVLSGKQPWSEVREDAAIILCLFRGRKPSKPDHRPIDDRYCEFIELCWSSIQERPTAEDVMLSVELFLSDHQPFPPLRDTLTSSPTLTQNSAPPRLYPLAMDQHDVATQSDEEVTVDSGNSSDEEYYDADQFQPSLRGSFPPGRVDIPVSLGEFLSSETPSLSTAISKRTTLGDEALPLPLDQEDDYDPDTSQPSSTDSLALDGPISPASPNVSTTPNQPTVTSKRIHALRELLSSERAYASDLALICDIHIPLALGQPTPVITDGTPSPPPFSTSSGSGLSSRTVSTASDSSTASSQLGPPMTRDDVRIIFGNIGDLAMFSDHFVDRLEGVLGNALDGGSGEDRVGALFLEIIPSLEPLYKTYITRHSTALAHLNALPSSPALSSYLARTRTFALYLTHTHDLPSLLLKPVQRLLSYLPLLDSILDATPDYHGDRAALAKAHERMEAMARGIDEDQRRLEIVHEVLGSTANALPGRSEPKKGNLGRLKLLRRPRAMDMPEDDVEALEVARLEAELQRYLAFLDKLGNDVKEWRLATRHALVALWQWGITFRAVIGLTATPTLSSDPPRPAGEEESEGRSEVYDAFTRLLPIFPGLCTDLEQGLQKSFIPVLCDIKTMIEAPMKLLSAMHSFDQNTHPPLAKIQQSDLTASQLYLALRSILLSELPILLRALNRATGLVVRVVAQQQVTFYAALRERWADLWDALKEEEEQRGGAEETLRVWRDKWGKVEEKLSGLKITRKQERWAKNELRNLAPQAGRPSLKVKSKLTDTFRPTHHHRGSFSVKSVGAPLSLARSYHSSDPAFSPFSSSNPSPYSPSNPSQTHSSQPSASLSSNQARPSQTLAATRALYTTRAIHPCVPPAGVSYRGLPFFPLTQGDSFDVLREYGHPSTHVDLPLLVDDGEDCLLLVRARSKGGEYEAGDVGWALASFLLPID